MAGTNDFKAFATDANANVTSQEEWETLTALKKGFSSGKASSAQVSKALRQPSTMAAVLGQFIANAELDALDDGDVDGLVAKLATAITTNLGLEDVVHLANFTSGVNWRRTPDGYIEQWGVSPAAVNGKATVTFPIPFPDSCQTIQLTEVTSSTTGLSGVISWGLSTDTITKTGFSAKASMSTSESLNWRALGK